jgi:hypothetical protein
MAKSFGKIVHLELHWWRVAVALLLSTLTASLLSEVRAIDEKLHQFVSTPENLQVYDVDGLEDDLFMVDRQEEDTSTSTGGEPDTHVPSEG